MAIVAGVMQRIPSLPTTIAMITALAAVPRLAASLYTPSMPSLMAAFDASMGDVKITFSAYIAGLAVGQILYGPISDSVGRRPVVLFGLSLFALFSFAGMFVPTIESLAVARFLQACCAGAGGVLSRAIVRDLFGPDRTARAFAFVAMATTTAPAVGPLIGGLIQEMADWRGVFLCQGLLGLVLLAWVALGLPETRPQLAATPTKPREMMQAFGFLLRSPPFMAYTLAGGAITASILGFFAAAPFLLIMEGGLTPSAYGLWSFLGVAGYFLGNYLATKVSNQQQIDPMVRAGGAVALLGSLIFLALSLTMPTSVWTVMAPFAIASCGCGMALPNCMAGSTNRYPHIAGTSSALSGFLQLAMATLATALLSLAETPDVAVALSMVMLAFATLALLAGFALKRWPDE